MYLSVDRNRTNTDEILNKSKPQSKVKFEKGGKYDRSIVRQFLFEYLSKRLSWSRVIPTMRDDACRYWFVAKSLKEYLLKLGKKEMTYDEIKELLESHAILNYANDVVQEHMVQWIEFMDKHMCDDEHADCGRDKTKPIEFLRPIRYFLYDPSWTMLANYLSKNGDSSLFRE